MDAAEAISAIARIDPPLKQPELAARYTTLLMDHGVSPVKAVVGALRAMDRPYKQILLAVERRHRGVVQHWSDLTEHLKVDGVGGLVRFLHELERGQQK